MRFQIYPDTCGRGLSCQVDLEPSSWTKPTSPFLKQSYLMHYALFYTTRQDDGNVFIIPVISIIKIFYNN